VQEIQRDGEATVKDAIVSRKRGLAELEEEIEDTLEDGAKDVLRGWQAHLNTELRMIEVKRKRSKPKRVLIEVYEKALDRDVEHPLMALNAKLIARWRNAALA